MTRYSAISTRKLTNALKILTCDKSIVAISDYDEFHKTVKRHVLTNVLGPNAQVCHLEIGLHISLFYIIIWFSSFDP